MAPFLFLITWWVAWLTPKPHRFIYKLTWYLLVSTVLVVTFSKTINAYDEYWHPQIILKQECKVSIGPDASYGVSTTLAPGTMVRLYEKQTGWCKIKRSNLMGWIPEEEVTMHVDAHKG